MSSVTFAGLSKCPGQANSTRADLGRWQHDSLDLHDQARIVGRFRGGAGPGVTLGVAGYQQGR